MGEASEGSKDGEWLEFLRKGIEDTSINTTPDQVNSSSKKKKMKMKKKSSKQTSDTAKKPAFHPTENPPPRLSLPDELWLAVLECACTFPAHIFTSVMLNLVKNPNITSSHLFRADIFYDSDTDPRFDPSDPSTGLVAHLQPKYRPIPASHDWPGFMLERTLVRQLVPRNPQLDRPMLQTCHFFTRRGGGVAVDGEGEGEEEDQTQTLVVYIPHATDPSQVPFYHPTLCQLAFLHTQTPFTNCTTILYRPFTSTSLSPKHHRTALHLLSTIHKHGQGALLGYTKRVHLDALIPQKTYQDTYTRLKTTHAAHLSKTWVEVTDPGKHVFEDLGIAAYLIELWRGMFGEGVKTSAEGFPGFVDIGCGNGLLVYVLSEEGYEGWGFDARERRSWAVFPESVRARLEGRVLVPAVFSSRCRRGGQDQEQEQEQEQEQLEEDGEEDVGQQSRWHDGIFKSGTFIISNHADELTPWTPLLAYLNNSAFIAIPCCSHDFAGRRTRAPATTRVNKEKGRASQKQENEKENDPFRRLSQLSHQQNPALIRNLTATTTTIPDRSFTAIQQAAETGSLSLSCDANETQSHNNNNYNNKNNDNDNNNDNNYNNVDGEEKKNKKKKITTPSAYSTLCTYIASLATELDFEAETDVLRIPSTRNACIVGGRKGRRRQRGKGKEEEKEEEEEVQTIQQGGVGEGGGETAIATATATATTTAGADAANDDDYDDNDNEEKKIQKVIELVERELRRDISSVGMEWIERVERLARKPGSGH